MANNNQIIIVDENDKPIGIGKKLTAHQQKKLHRSFSIFIFNNKKELLLQKRADNKYHSAGLWSNTCCSHPRPGKDIKEEAKQRLFEEMGIKTDLKEVFSFIYKAKLGNLTEHEFDHVFFGFYNQDPQLNPQEASAFKWLTLPNLEQAITTRPENYTYWLKQSLPKVIQHAQDLS